MKCRLCNTNFEPSDEEYAYAKQAGKPTQEIPYSYIEACLPKFCCYECFKHYSHFKSHGNKERLRKHKEKNRWLYHIGDKEPRAGSPDAQREEQAYRRKMEESCARKPPKTGHSGFSANMATPTLLPSELILGKASERILSESETHLGGEDGEKYNFQDE